MMSRLRPSQLPLRWRLALWYLLTLGILLLLFATFLYFQLRANLLDQLDASLQLVAAQTAIGSSDGQLAFMDGGALAEIDFVVFLTAVDGAVWDKTGRNSDIPPLRQPQPGPKIMLIDDDRWRVFGQEVNVDGKTGYVQVLGDMDAIDDTLERLLTLMFVGGPLALILAGVGGVFLASRALRPIDHMTQTAQTISASDLNRRIQYQGPADEVGRLAQTFDSMLERLQTAFERERRFTGDAAHELRTPLAALKGRVGVTLSRPRPILEYTATLQEMEGQVDRLIQLSNDLLFMARLDQRQRPLRLEPIQLRDFLNAVVEQVSPLAAAKQIELKEAIPDDLTIRGDMDLLIRLFLNLLDNAIKFTPDGGKVAVAAQIKNKQVHIVVTDTGPGIPAAHLPHLFERFYRAEGDRGRRGQDNGPGGAGLGLAIAYEIVCAHDGQLTVQSQPDQGTTFVVQLPGWVKPNKNVTG